MTQAVREQFTGIVRRALTGWVNDSVAKRIQTALGEDEPTVAETPQLPEGVVAIDGEIVTTQEELDAFTIVKAIVAGTIEVQRLHTRDTKSYCSVLIDNNNRRPLCRFRFNSKKQKYLCVVDSEKRETRLPIDTIDGIYAHADLLRETAARYAGT